MTRIASVEILQVDLPPPVPRSDAIQSFVTQETPIVRLRMDDGSSGTGYSHTIGTGGSSVVALLKDHLWRPTKLELYVMDRDGKNNRQVTTLSSASFARPECAPISISPAARSRDR